MSRDKHVDPKKAKQVTSDFSGLNNKEYLDVGRQIHQLICILRPYYTIDESEAADKEI